MTRSISPRALRAPALAPETEQWVADLAAMVAIDTSFPPGAGYGAFAELMERLLTPLGFACERIKVPEALWRASGAEGPRVNLVARRDTGRPVCSIYFHVDTAPVGDGWTMPPLSLTRDHERLHGRGAADMKGTIAATLAAIRRADADGVDYAFDPHLLLCTDEEGGVYPGVRYLAEQGLIEGHVLCLNGSAAPRVWAGCFGSLDLMIRIEGRAAHSGEGTSGVNAVDAALPILNALAALKMRVETRISALPPPPHWTEPLHARLNVTALRAGEKGSAVPGLCTIIVNRRYTPEECFEQVRSELEMTIAKASRGCGALSISTELVGHLSPVRDPDKGPHWPRWIESLSKGFGYAPDEFKRWGASSSSDMGFVQAAGRTEILLGGLGRPDRRIHGPDEFTTVSDVEALATAIFHHLTDSRPLA